MKKSIFLIAVTAGFLFSCSKTEIKQANDTIKSADSLFRSANDGFKTLDSISQIVKDSAKFNKVIVPEINKTKETVEKVISENAKSLDSINAVIKNSTEQIKRGREVLSTVDSAREELKNTNNPIDVLSTISKTIDKVSKQAKEKPKNENSSATEPQSSQPDASVKNQSVSPPAQPQPQPQVQTQETPVYDPLVKSLRTEITVDDLNVSRDQLTGIIRRNGGEIVTDNYGMQDGFRRQTITAKVPYQFFDELSNAVSRDLGTVKTKNTDVQGRDYSANQMCDVEITLSENRQFTGSESIATDNAEKNTAEEKSFTEKFGVTGIIIAVALVLIPLMLLILYLMNRSMKKKMEQLQQQNKNREQYSDQNIPRHNNGNAESGKRNYSDPNNNQNNDGDDPYAKYKPKN